VGERAQAIVVPELVEFLEMNLKQRSVPVKTQRISMSELKIREPKKELTTVEASLRLDAIASAGFVSCPSKMDLLTAMSESTGRKPP